MRSRLALELQNTTICITTTPMHGRTSLPHGSDNDTIIANRAAQSNAL